MRMLFFAVICFLSAWLHAECLAPTDQEKEGVRTYVSEQCPAFPVEHLSLTDNSQAISSCFWKMTFPSATNGRHRVFLSPDHRYITPVLFDLAVRFTEHFRYLGGAFRLSVPICESLAMRLNPTGAASGED